MNCFKCSHPKSSHGPSLSYPQEFLCFECFEDIKFYRTGMSFHKFPGNLDIIEHLAKEQNLI